MNYISPDLGVWHGWDNLNGYYINDLQSQGVINDDDGVDNDFPSFGQALQDTYMTDTQQLSRLEYQGQRLLDGYGSDLNVPTEYECHQHTWTSSRLYPESAIDDVMSVENFDRLHYRSDPPYMPGLQKRSPRFEGDLYTAPFIKGEGVDRAGWCGFCCSWHKLKESAFWYHMHYSHGVSCVTGRQLAGPQSLQWNSRHSGWRALCSKCSTWLTLGRVDKAAKTAYYRHAYQCHVRDNPDFEKRSGEKKFKSARKNSRGDR